MTDCGWCGRSLDPGRLGDPVTEDQRDALILLWQQRPVAREGWFLWICSNHGTFAAPLEDETD